MKILSSLSDDMSLPELCSYETQNGISILSTSIADLPET